ncbi:MAG TPA: tRNA threonylcarbamoyladenosine dehydratase [Opitutaceae bacterium]|nr:tRNA threonylcarbamoyladenosine dehydratase [Opitutaceae bacterium]
MTLSSAYLDRFGGIGRLYGESNLKRLQAARVAVFGLGGVGSWAAEALARTGIGQITLVDLDDVCVSNVNRQLPALEGAFGHPKVAVLAERIRAINPEVNVVAEQEFFTAGSAARLLDPGYDVVIDAIDNMPNKARLVADAVQRKFKCVTIGAAGGKRDGTMVRVSDLAHSTNDDMLRILRKRLRREHGFPHGEGITFGVKCVYSPEHPVYPWKDGTCSSKPEPGSDTRLDCNSGFGNAAFVTGSFGFAAANAAVDWIVEPIAL